MISFFCCSKGMRIKLLSFVKELLDDAVAKGYLKRETKIQKINA